MLIRLGVLPKLHIWGFPENRGGGVTLFGGRFKGILFYKTGRGTPKITDVPVGISTQYLLGPCGSKYVQHSTAFFGENCRSCAQFGTASGYMTKLLQHNPSGFNGLNAKP